MSVTHEPETIIPVSPSLIHILRLGSPWKRRDQVLYVIVMGLQYELSLVAVKEVVNACGHFY